MITDYYGIVALSISTPGADSLLAMVKQAPQPSSYGTSHFTTPKHSPAWKTDIC
jgi:hypothetical protein